MTFRSRSACRRRDADRAERASSTLSRRSWPNLTVVATDTATGTVVRTEAQAQGPVGTYVATIVFPTAGDWTLTFESTELEMSWLGGC